MTVLVEIRVDLEGGEEIYFHRQMELPFLPVEGMLFDFELTGIAEDKKYRRFVTFTTGTVCWNDRDQMVYAYLEVVDDEEEILTRECFKTGKWTEGQKETWLW